MNMLTIRQMQYFIAVAEEKSFSRAAERCYVTQSTLSAGIKEAENLLGSDLIDRSKRTPSLTALGEEVLPTAYDILEKTSQIGESASRYKQPMTAPIRLGIIPTIAPYLLPDLLPIIKSEYPNLDVRIFEDLSNRIYADLMDSKLDLIILALPYDTNGAEQHRLFEEDFYLAAPEGHAAADTISTQDLHPDELLLLADGHCLTDHALQACHLQRPAQRRTYSASSLTTLIQMVANGMGQTLLPAMVAQAGQLPDSVKITPFQSPVPKRMIGAAWKQGSARAQDYKILCDLVRRAQL